MNNSDEVFNQTSTNKQIFESMMMPIIDNVLEGYNCKLEIMQHAFWRTARQLQGKHIQ
jgi:hypothetical protein